MTEPLIVYFGAGHLIPGYKGNARFDCMVPGPKIDPLKRYVCIDNFSQIDGSSGRFFFTRRRKKHDGEYLFTKSSRSHIRQVSLVQGDINSCPLTDSVASEVHIYNIFTDDWIKHKERIMPEAVRILQPKGEIFVAETRNAIDHNIEALSKLVSPFGLALEVLVDGNRDGDLVPIRPEARNFSKGFYMPYTYDPKGYLVKLTKQ